MYITITGAQSTGKSTLVDILRKNPKLSNFKFIESITRSIQAKGFKINEQADDSTQLAMIDGHLQLLLHNSSKDCVADRCLIDVCAYTLYLFRKGQVKASTAGYALAQLIEALPEYDIIFYLIPEFDVVADGVRSESTLFRDEVASIYDMLINMLKSMGREIYILKGSVEERMNQLYDVLKATGEVEC